MFFTFTLTMNFIQSAEVCDLFIVERFDNHTNDRRILSYPPSDFTVASTRATYYQRTFGRDGRYRYSVQYCPW